ncbi:DUF4129 domain-containing protein [Kribbella turkmenica]|uniref:DUF4129 domain-containing protein n=1 Tax=Kribbella turkmenica TaxID=2530375 RepID=A0A4R4X5L6_9ACTN|nr:DUF4129 domain-containing protein [Kribbella turkmenica]TDD25671.1 DUF4129 domain-containing protein [Kribbella turkmenica]
MQRSRRGALTLVAVLMLGITAAGFVVLASAGGPVRPVSETTLRVTPRPVPPASPDETVSGPTPAPPPPERNAERKPMPAWIQALWQALVWLTMAALAGFLGWVIYKILRKVELPQAETEDTDWERMKADRLAEAVDSGLARIDTGRATDAVIACWVALEEAAASAGVAREPSETPAEFTVRVLGVGGISEPQLVRLGELYREARYSTHGSTEEARAEARSALLRLRDELAAAHSGSGVAG